MRYRALERERDRLALLTDSDQALQAAEEALDRATL